MSWYSSIDILSRLILIAQILIVVLTGFTIWASVQRGKLEKQEKSELSQQVVELEQDLADRPKLHVGDIPPEQPKKNDVWIDTK